MNLGCTVNIKKKIEINANSKNVFVIEGGGTKGIYAIGILKYLLQKNNYLDLNFIDIFAGTSVGSYLALCLSIGYNNSDFDEIIKIINIKDIFDKNYLFFVTAFRFLNLGHLYSNNGRINIIKILLHHKLDIINLHLNQNLSVEELTFGHLNQLINKYPSIYRHLLINTVDISRGQQLFITTLNDKWNHIKIIDALLASSAIPFVFPSVQFYYNHNTLSYSYEYSENSTINHLIDGSVSTNNPLDYFLIDNSLYYNYSIWLLKFTCYSQYTSIYNKISLFKQLVNYLLTIKNDVKINLLEKYFNINTINLKVESSILQIYNYETTLNIINNIFQKCISGEIFQ